MIKRIAAILVLAAAMAGCSASTGAPAPTVTVTASPSAPEVSATDEYLDSVRGSSSWFASVDDNTLLRNATATCQAFDNGTSLSRVIDISVDSGIPAQEGASLIFGAIKYICPEHYDDVMAQAHAGADGASA